MRKDLEEFYNKKEFLKDLNRSESVKKRHKKGSRTLLIHGKKSPDKIEALLFIDCRLPF